jgi:hypothetical protein
LRLLFLHIRSKGRHRLHQQQADDRETPRAPAVSWEKTVDLNHLFSRHQIALIDMMSAPCDDSRSWAANCADYYADRIADARSRVDGFAPLHWLPAKVDKGY